MPKTGQNPQRLSCEAAIRKIGRRENPFDMLINRYKSLFADSEKYAERTIATQFFMLHMRTIKYSERHWKQNLYDENQYRYKEDDPLLVRETHKGMAEKISKELGLEFTERQVRYAFDKISKEAREDYRVWYPRLNSLMSIEMLIEGTMPFENRETQALLKKVKGRVTQEDFRDIFPKGVPSRIYETDLHKVLETTKERLRFEEKTKSIDFEKFTGRQIARALFATSPRAFSADRMRLVKRKLKKHKPQ